MGVFLPTHTITPYRATVEDDGHGWSSVAGWTAGAALSGAVQIGPDRYTSTAADGGDEGPYAPTVRPSATVYLPPGSDVAPGDVLADGDGGWWLVVDAVEVPDPVAGDAGVRRVGAIAWEAVA